MTDAERIAKLEERVSALEAIFKGWERAWEFRIDWDGVGKTAKDDPGVKTPGVYFDGAKCGAFLRDHLHGPAA